MSASNFNSIRHAIGRYGTGVFRVGLNRILPGQLRFHKLLIYSQRLSQNPDMSSARVSPLQISLITSIWDPLFFRLTLCCPGDDFARCLLESDKECYVAHTGDTIVGYAWTVVNKFQISEINYQYDMGQTEIFIHDCFVQSEYRGLGVYPTMLRAILCDLALRKPELVLAFIGVFSENRPSRRGIVKAGFKATGSIRYMRWGKTEKWWRQ